MNALRKVKEIDCLWRISDDQIKGRSQTGNLFDYHPSSSRLMRTSKLLIPREHEKVMQILKISTFYLLESQRNLQNHANYHMILHNLSKSCKIS